MKEFLKKLFMWCFLLPVLPILGIPNGEGSDAGDDGEDETGGDGKKDKDGEDARGTKEDKTDEDSAAGEDKKDQDKLFTQDEMNAVISRRLDRERKLWEQKVEDEKKKAAMTESERLKTEKEEAEKKAAAATEKANQRLIRSEVIAQATKLDIIDPDAAFLLVDKTDIIVDEDNDSVKGVKEALTLLIKSKPYLVKSKDTGGQRTGDDQGDDKGSKGGMSMNSLIRKAAGRG